MTTPTISSNTGVQHLPQTQKITVFEKSTELFHFLSKVSNWQFIFPNSLQNILPVSDQFWMVKNKTTADDLLVKITNSKALMCLQFDLYANMQHVMSMQLKVIPKGEYSILSTLVSTDNNNHPAVYRWIQDFFQDLSILQTWSEFRNAS